MEREQFSPRAAPPPFVTPDRRVRVFVSSTLEELAAERAAVKQAIIGMRLTPVMFDLGVRVHPPRELYTSYLDQSDVFVGIYGERYGWVAPGAEISGLEDEYLLAGARPKLLYLKTPAPDREERLTALIERIWLSSGVSTTPYKDPQDLADRVANDLAVLLTERFAAHAPGGRRRSTTLRPEPLPSPTTSMIDREEELARLTGLLLRDDVRLVTVLGSGGIGKTRLALAAATALARSPGVDAVCFVDLAPLSEPSDVIDRLAHALGLHPGARPALDVLADTLDGRQVIAVLDNLEHLLEARADLAGLLARCPGLRLLVTSRAVLHLHGEHEVLLGPLALPSGTGLSPHAAAQAPAVQLLVARAQQVRPDFAVTASTVEDVVALVRRLDGIPLALELAAARLRLLPVTALLSAPGAVLDLPSADVDTPARQQTLRTTIAWSIRLLDERQKELLRRLSVLVGGWTLPAAAAVGPPGWDVVEQLSALVEHSLVSVDVDAPGEPRFRMLQSVRLVALDDLTVGGGVADVMHALSTYALRLVADAAAGLATGGSRAWRTRLDGELDTLRSVLAWAVESDDATLAVRITAPLARYWWSRGLLVEMLSLADDVAQLPSAAHLSAAEADALAWSRATIRIATGQPTQGRELLQATAARARQRGDDALLGSVLFSLALVTDTDGRPSPRQLLTEAADLFDVVGDPWGRALALVPLGELELVQGRLEEAATTHALALGCAQAVNDDHMRAVVLDQLAVDALLAGDAVKAGRLLCEAAAIHLEVRDTEGIANCLDGFAALALARGDGKEAAGLVAAAERVRAVAGVVVWPFLRPLRERLVSLVDAAAPAGGLAAARAASSTSDPVELLESALSGAAGVSDGLVSRQAAG